MIFLACLLLAAAVSSWGGPLWAEDAKVLAEKARALCDQGRHPEALRVYEEAMQADPSLVGAYRGVVQCYRNMGDLEAAIRFMESLYLEHPERAEVFYGMGYALYEAGRHDAARQNFEKAVSLNPDLAEAWNNCAVIHHFIDRDYDRARACYEKAIAVSRRTKNDHVLAIAEKNLANLPVPVNLRPVKERLTLEEFLSRFVARVDERDEIGVRELVMGQKGNCLQAMDWLLDEAMRLGGEGRSQDEEARLLLATLLEKEYVRAFGDTVLEKRLKAYGRLTPEAKTNRARGEALLRKGSDQETAGRFEEARRHYNEALGCFEKIGDRARIGLCHVYIGDAFLKAGEPLPARQAYEKGLSIFVETGDAPRQAAVLSSLGAACIRLRERDEALTFLRRSLAIYDRMGEKEMVLRLKEDIRRLEEGR